jgi:cation:H+ antiporter
MGILLLILGLVLLVFGAEVMVRGAARTATVLGVPPMVIGLTVVAIGTSTPELAVSISAGLKGSGGLGVGNIAGANVFVMLFVMGLSALWKPLPLQAQVIRLELPMIVVAALMMTALAWDGRLSQLDGLILLGGGIGYTLALLRMTRRASRAARKEFRDEYGPQTVHRKHPRWLADAGYVVMLLGGIALVVTGAELLVRGAVSIAEAAGVSTGLIGLTIVAFGTSSPELVTTLVATYRDDRDVAVGNLVGSGVYNILAILAIACAVTPGGLPVERRLLSFDLPLMAGVAIGAVPVFITGRRVSRFEGGLGIAIYLSYLTWLVVTRT